MCARKLTPAYPRHLTPAARTFGSHFAKFRGYRKCLARTLRIKFQPLAALLSICPDCRWFLGAVIAQSGLQGLLKLIAIILQYVNRTIPWSLPQVRTSLDLGMFMHGDPYILKHLKGERCCMVSHGCVSSCGSFGRRTLRPADAGLSFRSFRSWLVAC